MSAVQTSQNKRWILVVKNASVGDRVSSKSEIRRVCRAFVLSTMMSFIALFKMRSYRTETSSRLAFIRLKADQTNKPHQISIYTYALSPRRGPRI